MTTAGIMLAHQVAAKAFRDATFLTAWPATALPLMMVGNRDRDVALVPIVSRLLRPFPTVGGCRCRVCAERARACRRMGALRWQPVDRSCHLPASLRCRRCASVRVLVARVRTIRSCRCARGVRPNQRSRHDGRHCGKLRRGANRGNDFPRFRSSAARSAACDLRRRSRADAARARAAAAPSRGGRGGVGHQRVASVVRTFARLPRSWC